MKKISAIIIDDEPLAHRVIERFATDIPFLEIAEHFYFATEAYGFLAERAVDLIFLDIEMPKLKGIDFLKSLRERPQIILTTAYEEYALEGFELQVTDYLLKPFSFSRFLAAVQKVLHLESTHSVEGSRNIFVKVDKRQVQINTGDIQYLESYGNYVKIFHADKMILTPKTLSNFEKELANDGFERVHKSYLVNRKYVKFVEGNSIFMSNDITIPIGKSYRSMVKTWFS